MQIIGVAVAGGSSVFARPLEHGVDPHRLAWELGYRIVRPLSASGVGDELTVTVQVSAHGRPVSEGGVQRRRSLDRELTEADVVDPLVRQRLAAYAMVLSSHGLLATEFSNRTAVPHSWGLPGGGIDPGENPSQAVIREAIEETGQHIEIAHLLDIQTDHWIGRSPTGVVEDFHAVRIIYAATCPEPTTPVVNDVGGTTASARWVPLHQWYRTHWAAGTRALLDRHLATISAQLGYRRRSAG
ncbi:NUDIX hydrolase [Micropruina sonneratiae]|uniref:NUDIX hydrolase n=1 Tax=Micropruina sonneratiae TaxID=2986940 RepID=UPI002227259B|nr:NUDIX domain-containing protein [Micropruina sp. KQZ13P-5]MCW3158874.1 NUDIX domain-containing protein [Micropruina sp. KQZ13P-5]